MVGMQACFSDTGEQTRQTVGILSEQVAGVFLASGPLIVKASSGRMRFISDRVVIVRI
jgi:hypothetical protein